MKANATISINKARQLRWSRTLHAKLPTASAIAPVISTNSARSVAKKPNPIKGKTAIKSGIERQWIRACDRETRASRIHEFVVKISFQFYLLILKFCVGASCARDLTIL